MADASSSWSALANQSRAIRNATLTLTPHSNAAPRARKPLVDGPAVDSLSQIIVQGLEDAKAEDIVTIELVGKTTLAYRLFIATARSSTHVGAIADRVVEACPI